MRACTLLAAACLLSLCSACHQAPPPAPVPTAGPTPQQLVQHYTEAAATDVIQKSLGPSEMVTLYQQDGVGLALQVTGRRFRVGQDVPLLLAYQDIDAKQPISSSTCSGFTLALEDIDRQRDDLAMISPCRTDTEYAVSKVPLVKGNLRFLHTSLFANRLQFTHPGRYLVNAGWQSFRPREGMFHKDDSYAVVRSNIVPIVVTP